MHFATQIGMRYTQAGRKSGLLSFLSGISMTGLVLGVSLLVVVLSVMNGFERELRERILGLMPQASLYRAGGVDDWRALSNQIQDYSGLEASAPFVQVSALITYRSETLPALMYGVDIESELRISNLSEFVKEEALNAMRADQNRILLGADIAAKLNVATGAEIMVLAPGKSQRSAPRVHYMEIAGIIKSQSELDQTLIIARLDGIDAIRPSSLRGKVDGLRLQFEDLDQAPWLSNKLAFELGREYYQTNWQRTHGNLYHAIKMSKTMVALLMSLIVALATFNVVSTLILVVTEKQGSIAILRTLGAKSNDILRIFIVQGLLIGAGGVGLGILFGLLFVQLLGPFVTLLESVFQLQFLHSDVYPLTDIPVQVRFSDILTVTGIAMVLVFAATLFPAWKASKLQPADVLRYE